MKKIFQLIIVISILILSACNDPSETGSVTVIKEAEDNTSPTAAKTDGTSTFSINDTTTTFASTGAKNTASYDARTHSLLLFLQGYLPPNTDNKQLSITIKNFTEKPGAYMATATYDRTDESGNSFHYEGTNLNVHLTGYVITSQAGSKTGAFDFEHALVSGSIEGTLDPMIFDPAKKLLPLAKQLHVKGSFNSLVVTEVNAK